MEAVWEAKVPKGLSRGHGLCLLLTSATAPRTRLVSVSKCLDTTLWDSKAKILHSMAKLPRSSHIEQRQH